MTKYVYAPICLLLAMIMSVSCSKGGKMKELLNQVPASADFVAVGNVKTIVESLGGSLEGQKLTMPSNIMEALPADAAKELDDLNKFLQKSGVDAEACALIVDYEENKPVVVCSLDDAESFAKAIEGEGLKKESSEGDMTLYSKDDNYIAVNGSCAYIAGGVYGGNTQQYLKKIADEANDKSMGSTDYGDYMAEGNAGGIAFKWPKEIKDQMSKMGLPSEILSVYSGVICMRNELSENKWMATIKMYNEDGDEVESSKFGDVSTTISADALDLLAQNENVILAFSLKGMDWDKVSKEISASGLPQEQRAAMDAIYSYLKNIDGSVAVGFGLTNGVESVNSMCAGVDALSQFSATIVVETKEGTGKDLVNGMKGMLTAMGIPVNETGSGFSVVLDPASATGGTIYVSMLGNTIAVANHPVKSGNGNALAKRAGLTDYAGAFCIGLSKGDQLTQDLGIDTDVTFLIASKPKSNETEMSLEISGDSNTGVLAKLVKVILSISNKTGNLMPAYSQDDLGELCGEDMAYEDELADTAACY